VGSAALGLLAFAVVLVLVSRPAPKTRTAPGTTAPPTATAQTPAASGPFTSARTAFLAAIAAPSGSSTPNNVAPPPTPNGDTAPTPSSSGAPATSSSAKATKPGTTAAAGAWTAVPSGTDTAPVPAAGGALGTLKVVCFPACDQVFDNGASLGPSPLSKKVSVGSHRLKLVWSDANLVVSTVVIADQSVTVRQNHP
jgi:hypothetical protein